MTQNIYTNHDHHGCVDTALERARHICARSGARLTAVRQRVLELVWQSHKPTGAYELLPVLAKEGFNSAPPTVYRALDFLLELGLIHRINSLNAFIGCSQPEKSHHSCFFVCRQCGQAQELDGSQTQQLASHLENETGFIVEQQTTEMVGLCSICQSKT